MKNKKIILSILLFTFVVLFTNVNAASPEVFTTGTEGDYTYTVYLEDGKYWAELNTYTGSSASPVILTKIGNKYAVTKLGNNLFANNTTITSIVVPDNIKVIGEAAFKNCTQLNKVVLSNNLEIMEGEIYTGVFYNCDSLTSITIPKTVTKAIYTFKECNNLTSVILENGMTTIPELIFADTKNSNLEVSIPNTVTTIGDKAFKSSYISNIKLPDSIKVIGEEAFYGCNKLTEIILPKNLTTIGGNAFSYCLRLTSMTIPKTVTFAPQIFYECWDLTQVILEQGMTTIPNCMFQNSSSLNLEVSIPSTITSVGEYAFYNSNIKKITLPDSITSIGTAAFASCFYLTDVKLPSNLKTMDGHAGAIEGGNRSIL